MPNPTLDKQIEQLQQEITERREKLVELLKENAAPLKQNYVLRDWNNNPVTLNDLFGEKDDLILIHNMGKSCRYCTLWADEINGVRHHLEDRAALAMVNPNAPEVQKEFAESRNWGFRMVSDQEMDFTYDMGFAMEKEGKRYAQPGYSTFHRDPDGTVRRVGYDWFGPGDMYSSVWHFFELLDQGSKDWEPQYKYEKSEAIDAD